MWISTKDRLPPLHKGDMYSACEMASDAVLGVVHGQRRVVVLEQWDTDEPPRWYAVDSEHWDLGQDVTHWQEMEDMP